MATTVWIGADVVLNLTNCVDVTGTVVNAATVTCQLQDATTGANIGPPVTLTSIDSNGDYQGILPHVTTASLAPGQAVYLYYFCENGSYVFPDRVAAVANYADQ